MMKKPIALTFTAAVLLMASITTYVYGQHSSSAAEDSLKFSMTYCGFEPQRGLLELAAILIGVLAVSVVIVFGLLWNRETQSAAENSSVLGLNGIRARPIVRLAAPCEKVVTRATNVDGSYAHEAEDDYLTPLERVIRGY